MIEPNPTIERFSNYERMLRVVSLCLRWKHRKGKNSDPITVDELKQTESQLIKCVQNETFFSEIMLLKNGKSVEIKSSIRNLDPYVDTIARKR